MEKLISLFEDFEKNNFIFNKEFRKQLNTYDDFNFSDESIYQFLTNEFKKNYNLVLEEPSKDFYRIIDKKKNVDIIEEFIFQYGFSLETYFSYTFFHTLNKSHPSYYTLYENAASIGYLDSFSYYIHYADKTISYMHDKKDISMNYEVCEHLISLNPDSFNDMEHFNDFIHLKNDIDLSSDIYQNFILLIQDFNKMSVSLKNNKKINRKNKI